MATTTNQVLLSAKTSIRHGGKMQSLGQQFYASAEDAKRLVDGGQAERVSAAGAVEPVDAGAEPGESSGTAGPVEGAEQPAA